MERIQLPPRPIAAHAESAGPGAISELRRLAEPLRNVRVLHVSATPVGGGVAEILTSAIPLLRDLGVAASWRTIVAEPTFFEATKAIHNALQGDPRDLSTGEQSTYLAWQERIAAQLTDHYDVIVVHDPQPFGLLRAASSRDTHWIWRLHVDSSHPNPAVWSFLQPFLTGYHAAVFTLPQFVPPGVDADRVRIIAPAIDPLTPKNVPMPPERARAILIELGLDPERPLIAQISRLDPWKDPMGVIDAYRQIRHDIPGLQLALLGVIAAQDDPEAVGMAEKVRAHAAGDPDIHIFIDPTRVRAQEVVAVQQSAQVIIQKSLREGFGLTVAEALWKETPVVASRVGGIPLQIEDDIGGFTVESVAETAERTRWLVEHPAEARAIAARGRDRVRDQFLITRLLADELRLYAEVLGQRELNGAAD